MKIEYLGHACFKLEDALVIDPYKDVSVPGLAPLRVMAAKVICSHEHADHSGRECVELADKECNFEIREVPSFHDDAGGALRGPNTIFVITSSAGEKLVHLGDLGHFPNEEQLKAISDTDYLLIPVGGHYTIDVETAVKICEATRPKNIIPMHYRTKTSGYPELAEVDGFLELAKERGIINKVRVLQGLHKDKGVKIGVFDSGKGGTTVLAAIKELLPEAEYMYIADSKNCPYGEKDNQELLDIATGIVDRLLAWGADVIVIACNTVTTRCIERLREMYKGVPFVGTEPAIRLALKMGARKTLVMATPGTIESERTAQIVAENQQPGQKITLLACPGLADAIERNQGVEAKLDELLSGVSRDYDVIVLGCTHYSLIKDAIKKRFRGSTLVDGNEGVARRILNIVKQI